jgi:glycine/D-amino acid oxidase-like deaminating enzyme
MRAHTLVIGGGVMGLSIAAELAARLDPLEAPVVLLERREFGAGSSGRSGAILRAFYSDRELIGMARTRASPRARAAQSASRAAACFPSALRELRRR